MIVAIQQPEHLPWIGFFNKMAQSDLFVYLDNVQLKKRYFENRNRIKTNDGPKWITVPIHSKGKYTQNINQVIIDNESRWTKKYMGIIERTYKKSPFWNDVKKIVFPCLVESRDRLVDLNYDLIKRCRDYLQISTPVRLASALQVDRLSGSGLILDICIKTKADIYISGTDGKEYLDIDRFNQKGIKIVYHDFIHPDYPQQYGAFESHLSIIDLIANMGPKSSHIVRECYKAGSGGMMSDSSN